MLDVTSDANEVLNAILKGKTADEQVKILRGLYSDALGHGWVDDEVRNSIFQSACRDYNIPYSSDADDTDDLDDEDDDLLDEMEEAMSKD